MDLTSLNISQIRDLLTSRKASAVEVAQAHLAQIEAKDKDVRAYLSVSPERALAQAAKVDAAFAEGKDPGPLAGVPVAIKDGDSYQGANRPPARHKS